MVLPQLVCAYSPDRIKPGTLPVTGEKERKHLDFELNKTSLPYHRLMFHTTVSREESVEMIVPDSCPDIAHLLDTSAICCLDTKEALEDTVSLAGRIYGRILYLADGSDALCSLPVALDFQCGVNQDGILPSCQVIALTRVRTAETKAVNSRKVLVRVQYEVSLRVYQPDLLTIPCGVAQGDGVEQRLESAEGYFVVAVPEKQFQFQDDLTLSGGQPAISEVLRMQSDVTCTEAKLIGGKLVFKGEVSVRMLYRSVEEDVLTADFVLPYSQIMDAAEAAENADFQIEVALLGWTLGELDYDGRSIPIDLELYACAEVRQVETVSLLGRRLQCPPGGDSRLHPLHLPPAGGTLRPAGVQTGAAGDGGAGRDGCWTCPPRPSRPL